MKHIILLTIIFIQAVSIQAQDNCLENLYQANVLFEKGNLQDAINLAKSCANSENKTERWQSFHLLAKAYLADNQKAEAKEYCEKMMEISPTYQPTSKDPKEMAKLIESVKVVPKFSLGLTAMVGGNITYPFTTATFNGADYEKEYHGQKSWQLGMIVGYNMNSIISLHTGLIATNKVFAINYSIDQTDFNITENLTYLNLPAFARFTTSSQKGFRFFGDVGVYSGRLIGSHSDFERNSNLTNETFNANRLDAMERRNKWEYGSIFGVGAMHKLGKVNLTLDVKYYVAGFTNITNSDARYQHDNLYYGYYFLDDDIRLNNLAISLSAFYYVNYRVIKGK